MPLRTVEQFNQGEARERLEQHWGEPERVYMAALYTYYEETDVDKIWPASALRQAARTCRSSAAALTSSTASTASRAASAPRWWPRTTRAARPLRVAAGAAVGRALLRAHAQRPRLYGGRPGGGGVYRVPRVARRHRANVRRAAGGHARDAARRRLRRRRRHGLRRVGGGGRPALPLRRRVGGGARDDATHAVCRLPSGGADAEVPRPSRRRRSDAARRRPPAAADGRRPRRARAERRRFRGRGAVHVLRRAVDSVGDADRRAGNGGTVVRVDGAGFARSTRTAPTSSSGAPVPSLPRSSRARPARRRGVVVRPMLASCGGMDPQLVDARARHRRRRDARSDVSDAGAPVAVAPT